MSFSKLIRNLVIGLVAIAVLVFVALVAYNAINNSSAAASQAEQTVNNTITATQEPAPVVTPAPAVSATTIPVEETEAYKALLAMYQQAQAEADAAKAEADAAEEATPVVTEVPVSTPAPVQEVPAQQVPVLVTEEAAEEQEKDVQTLSLYVLNNKDNQVQVCGWMPKDKPNAAKSHGEAEDKNKKWGFDSTGRIFKRHKKFVPAENALELKVVDVKIHDEKLYKELLSVNQDAGKATLIDQEAEWVAHWIFDGSKEGKKVATFTVDFNGQEGKVAAYKQDDHFCLRAGGSNAGGNGGSSNGGDKPQATATPAPANPTATPAPTKPAPTKPAPVEPTKAPAHNDDNDNVVTDEEQPAHNDDDDNVVTDEGEDQDQGNKKPSHSDDNDVVVNENGDITTTEQLPSKQPAHTEDESTTTTVVVKPNHSDDDNVVVNENGDEATEEIGLPKK